MKDRVPKYPGRYRLIPVPGQEGVYDLERADEPVEVGTALNKAALLSDATAALYRLGSNALPDEVLKLLGDAVLQKTSAGSLTKPSGASITIPYGNLGSIPASKITGLASEARNGTVFVGTYTGDDKSKRTINIGFTPKMVLVIYQFVAEPYGLVLEIKIPDRCFIYYICNSGKYGTTTDGVTAGGFIVDFHTYPSGFQPIAGENTSLNKYWYIAIGRA